MPLDRPLVPFQFHFALASALEKTEPGLWRWFASDDYGKKYAESVKLELLRSTYRLPRESHEKIYAIASEAALALGVAQPLTIYQSYGEATLNAGLVFSASDAHVVMQGPVIETLDDAELRALFGHELAHHRLWTEEGGRFHTTDVMIEHVVRQRGSSPSHVQSALRLRRWTELYADRGSLVACQDLDAAVSCLVKMSSGLRQVDPKAYLAQANEVLTKPAASEGITHPEAFIRAWALANWHQGDDDARLKSIVQGPVALETLDLIQQSTLTETTKHLIRAMLAPEFMRTETTLTHARRFFLETNFDAPEPADDWLPREGDNLNEYFAYILLDFALADPDLEDTALAHAAAVGRRLGLEAVMPRVARKELRLSAAAWSALEDKGAMIEQPRAPVEGGAL